MSDHTIPLLTELHRYYADEGVPRLEQQAADLIRLITQAEAGRTAAAIRAAKGYARAKRDERRRVDRWERHLPSLLRSQAE